MNEENKNNLENETENLEKETVQETAENEAEVTETPSEENTDNTDASAEAEEVTEAAENAEAQAFENAADETAEEAGNIADEAETPVTEAFDENGEPMVIDGNVAAPKKNTGKIAGISIACVAVAVVIILAIFFGPKLMNKYNRMGYIDTTGRTIGEVADANGYELADFLASYDLPADMPESTYESVAYYMIPAKKVAEMYGMDFASLKEMLGWDDTVTEDTPWGEAEGETTLSKYVGEDNLSQFKEQYNLGDEITGETKWKEIRNIIDQQARDERIAAEKEEAAAKKSEEESATEAPADDAAATEAPVDGATETPAE